MPEAHRLLGDAPPVCHVWPTLFLQPHFVEVVAAVSEILHASIGVEVVEPVEVYVADKNHLGVWRSLCTCAVGGEFKVARREHARLCILDIHIVDSRKVAHAAGNHYVALVFDGSRMRAYLYA